MKKSAILFYVLSVIYLAIAIFTGVIDFLALAESASSYGVNLLDEWLTVFNSILTTSSGFLAFSGVFLGIVLIIRKLSK